MPYPVFPTHLFAFDDQDIDIERRVISGGTSLAGEEDLIATDGGGRVYAEFQNGPLLERETNLAWRSYTAQLDGGVTPVIVPFCDPEHQPWVEGEAAPVGSVQIDAALRATTLHLAIDLPRPLLGGEWFSIDHPGAGHRAYKIGRVLGQSGSFATVEIRPPLREAVYKGEAVDFEPRCLMVQQGPTGSLTNLGKYAEASIRFVEAPYVFAPASLFFGGSDGFLYDFSRMSTLYQAPNFTAPLTAAGQTVGYVRDLSGNDNHAGQATVGERPTFDMSPDGIHGVYFDGVDDFLDIATSGLVFEAAGATTLVFAVKFMPNNATGALAQVIYAEAGSGTGALYYLSTATLRSQAEDDDANAKLRFGVKTDAAVTGALDSDEAVADDQIRIASMRENSAHALEIWIDNRKEVSTATRTGTFTLTQSGIGAIPGASPSSFLKGWVFGAFGINKTLTDAELLKVQAWMAARYHSTRRAADGVSTLPVLPKEVYFHGKRLLGSVTLTNGIRVTDMEYDGDFRGRAYSPFSMGASDGDAHSAPSLLPLSDGRLMMTWTGHSANYYVRTTLGPSIEPGQWGTTRHLTPELGLANPGKYTYASAAEMATGVFLFVRSRTGAETNSQLGYWYTSNLDPEDEFPDMTKFIAGNRPYVMHAKRDPWRIYFQVSTGHPTEQATNSIYGCYMDISQSTGAVTFHKLDGTPLTLPMAPSDMTLIHDGTTSRAWIGSVAIGADGHPRFTYEVYNDLVDDHTFWHARWTGSAIVASPIASDNGLIIEGLYYATGNVTLDPEDPTIAYLGRLVAPETVTQIWRYTTDDDGLTWTGAQLTNEDEQAFSASIIEGAPEPRLVYTVGPFDDVMGVFVGDTRRRLVNSVTGAAE